MAILIGLWMGYNYVNETYIKPYKQTMDEIKETYDNVKNTENNLTNLFKKNSNKE